MGSMQLLFRAYDKGSYRRVGIHRNSLSAAESSQLPRPPPPQCLLPLPTGWPHPVPTGWPGLSLRRPVPPPHPAAPRQHHRRRRRLLPHPAGSALQVLPKQEHARGPGRRGAAAGDGHAEPGRAAPPAGQPPLWPRGGGQVSGRCLFSTLKKPSKPKRGECHCIF